MFALPLPALADLQAGLRACETRDYETALDEFLSSAQAGDADAQYYLGMMHDDALGVPENHEIAVHWYALAARQDHAEAQFSLAYCAPTRKRPSWTTSAPCSGTNELRQGHHAQFNLALMYNAGEGVDRNDERASHWYKQAALHGHTGAQHNLAFRYEQGKGVAKDVQAALRWFEEAAVQGHAGAQYSLALRYDDGDGVAQDVERAVYWYSKAAAQGHAWAQNNLGIAYDNGAGIALDHEQAAHWYERSADQGNASAQYNLARLYDRGEGVAEDREKAAYWYEQAAQGGDSWAQYALAIKYKMETASSKTAR